MEKTTKERILEEAVRLFSRRGYMGTSMSDIAGQLGITKAALYKHYTGKQEILDCIIQRIDAMELARMRQYAMPEGCGEQLAAGYRELPLEHIQQFAEAQFLHWTEEGFSSCFRRMLTLEQYRDPEMAKRYQHYLGSGPVSYMEELFGRMTGNAQEARQLALSFYGPIVVLYSIYDETGERDAVLETLRHHVTWFSHVLEQTSREGAESDD